MSNVWRSHARRQSELDEEIRGHLEMAIRDRMARGETWEEAERAARREFGDVTTLRDPDVMKQLEGKIQEEHAAEES